ncbi:MULTISPECIES: TrpB-like pyridoxal phosphate-dependent enzyme [Kitasatospora]|uniref:tryptophan synthase n=1 Tax=Kitasatospora herbaricolor TaxID=68217 RepID=A0ABZ1W903_9ACTN|nr:TrpB-like pyridoxal phosphate-dependent enzyme [Kitasatospora herbaricolor]MDQ0310095.1 tryptophan synthase beta chain [Kitasatospora herbaricolor]GGV17757.1 tryptophan synthase beta chain [Kitasatospora herbaricolor]
MVDRVKFQLDDKDVPTTWYNLAADLPGAPLAPALSAATGAPLGRDELAALMPEPLIDQEIGTEREFEIPEPVRQIYAMWRPAPLFRARRLERALNTPARIYYKYEGVSPAGSHKPNTGIAQAFYNKEAGKTGLVTETGAGQWGSATALSAAFFGMTAKVFMVRVSFEQKPYRKSLMETYGAVCTPSPSVETAAGRAILAADPKSPGSLGIATSEALETAAGDPSLGYVLGSAANHVLAHQTVIGQEALRQMELADDYPDIVIGAAGGGSNLAGLAFPFLGAQLRGGPDVRIIAVEPASCPTLTRGRIAYDYADTGRVGPLFRMHTLGHSFVPPAMHAGGLRAHGIGPLISRTVEDKLIEPVAVAQTRCFEAGVQFARTEGILPAPESTHAIRVAIDEAIRCREEGRSQAILFGLSGHGHFDLVAYEKYFAGSLEDDVLDEAVLAAADASIPAL